ncbi:MAG: four helix bundle protein [Limisphaerales bacterium]
MAKAERFEDLIVWQEARLLRKEVYQVSKNGPFARDFEMRGQIRGAALSAMDNIAEGFERGSNKEFAQFLNISRGSAGEVRSALYAALDEGYVTSAEFESLHERALSVARRCSKLITHLQNSRYRQVQPNQTERTT